MINASLAWILAVTIFGFWFGFFTHYIVYRGDKVGAIVIKKTNDPNENDRVSFLFSIDTLDDLYGMKTVRMDVHVTDRETYNSINDDN